MFFPYSYVAVSSLSVLMEVKIEANSLWVVTEESKIASFNDSSPEDRIPARGVNWDWRWATGPLTSVSVLYFVFRRLLSALNIFTIVLLADLCCNLSQAALAVSQYRMELEGFSQNAGRTIYRAFLDVFLSKSPFSNAFIKSFPIRDSFTNSFRRWRSSSSGRDRSAAFSHVPAIHPQNVILPRAHTAKLPCRKVRPDMIKVFLKSKISSV